MKSIKQFKSNPVALCCALALTSLSFQSMAGSILGKVTDNSTKRLLQGAKISIPTLNVSTSSNKSGEFRFDQLPAGEYTLIIAYLGTETTEYQVQVNKSGTQKEVFKLANLNSMENVIAYGQRAGQAGALNTQKNADSIKSIVSADAIGQFPDQNVSEALQRLPGLSIERDQGEGRFVGIRGIDPNLNSVTINGLNVPAPESGVRSVALDVIPSQLIGGLEVSKTVTPDMDADAIGGSIEVKSLSGFDRAEQSISVTGQLSLNQLRDESSPKFEASYTDVFNDKMAIAVAVSHAQRNFGSDNIESNADDEVEQRFYDITRKRTGAAVNLDFRPDFNNQYYIRTLYSEFSDDEYRLNNTFVFDGEDSEVERGTKDRKETQQIISITAGAEHQIDSWKLEYQLGYSKAEEDNPNALNYAIKSLDEEDRVSEFSFSSDMQGQKPAIEQSTGVQNLANYELDEIEFASERAQDTETSLKLDLTKSLTVNDTPVEIQFGGKYRQREKNANANIVIYDDFDDFSLTPADFETSSPDWTLGQFGPGLNRSQLRTEFFNQQAVLGKDDNTSLMDSLESSYSADEDILAIYALTRFDINKLRVIAGLRYENTEFSTQGTRAELIEDEQNDIEQVVDTPWYAENEYSKIMPSVNLRYEFSDQLIARAAFTQTLSRPQFEHASAYQLIETVTEENDEGGFDTEKEASIVGNPDLKPYESDNFDLSLEYYPGHIGVLSVGYFHKNIDNFIILTDLAGTTGKEEFDEYMQFVNGESATLSGFELAWVKSFDNGFLLATNATLTDSDATTFLDGKKFKTSLPNQSDTVANVTLGYESDRMSIRLTSVYKSNNLEEIDGELIRYEDNHNQLDLSSKFYLNQQTYLYFNAVNLNDEPMYHYFGNKNINAQYETYGRTFELGFSWTSF
ncbi:TonB-dependent receptor [Catenovulum adriaticum]|uniref:TonB-dependent receptor n=1 Tax=Catenovulum adriaticum TaxID=2984846 RepID=A0ABY7ARA1_9ALTE|nr:TonB-dependent receptor [Catenovulum sp. TS8]WAJ71850.1 TonB-dependent receptor [Catenovulum sp. TS8]